MRRRDDARHRTQTLRARDARRCQRERALRPAHVRADVPSRYRRARDSRWRFRSRARSASTTRSSSARNSCSTTRERDYESALAELSQRNAELQSGTRCASTASAAARRERETAHARSASALDARAPRVRRNRPRSACSKRLRDFVARTAAARRRTRSERGRKVTPSQAALLAETIEAMRRDLGIGPEAAAPDDAGAFAAGDRVRIASLATRRRTSSRTTATTVLRRDRSDEDRRGEERRARGAAQVARTSARNARAGRGGDDARVGRGDAQPQRARRAREAVRRRRADRRALDRRGACSSAIRRCA